MKSQKKNEKTVGIRWRNGDKETRNEIVEDIICKDTERNWGDACGGKS